MTCDLHPTARSIVRRLRPSPANLAAAAAAYDPGPLLGLQAAQRKRVSSPTRPRRQRPYNRRRSSARAVISPCLAK